MQTNAALEHQVEPHGAASWQCVRCGKISPTLGMMNEPCPGPPAPVWAGPEPGEVCDICDGGPGNDCQCSCGHQAFPSKRKFVIVKITDEVPPETTEDRVNRKYLLFLMVQLGEILANVQHALSDVIMYGPGDDLETPCTRWEKLEAAFERLIALQVTCETHGFPLTSTDAQVAVEVERIRQRYQECSGRRGLLHLPIWDARPRVDESPLPHTPTP